MFLDIVRIETHNYNIDLFFYYKKQRENDFERIYSNSFLNSGQLMGDWRHPTAHRLINFFTNPVTDALAHTQSLR